MKLKMTTLFQKIQNSINLSIDSYIDDIHTEFGLDKSELKNFWLKASGESLKECNKREPVFKADTTDLSLGRLNNCNRAELVALCKQHQHKVSGKKEDLINRLMGKDGPPKGRGSPVVKAGGKPKTKATKGKPGKAMDSIPVLKKLTSNIPVVPVRTNVHKNLEHPETGLVFNPKTKKVIGKQEDDGTISELTDDDIQSCKRFKFQYDLPKNLDRGNGDTIIEGLESDSDISITNGKDISVHSEISDGEEDSESDEDVVE